MLATAPPPAVHRGPCLLLDRPHLGHVIPPWPLRPPHPPAGLPWLWARALQHGHVLRRQRLQHAPAQDQHTRLRGTPQHSHRLVPRCSHLTTEILKKLYPPLSAHSKHPIPCVLRREVRTPGMGCFECADSGGYGFFKIFAQIKSPIFSLSLLFFFLLRGLLTDIHSSHEVRGWNLRSNSRS